jgi:YVTN family beta-propeller protein
MRRRSGALLAVALVSILLAATSANLARLSPTLSTRSTPRSPLLPAGPSGPPGVGNSTSVIGVVATTPVGDLPSAMAYDAADGWVYVANQGSPDLTVLNGTAVQASVHVGVGGLGVAYDPGDEMVYIADFGSNNVSVVDGTTQVAMIPVGGGPISPVYDPEDGYVYVPDYNSRSVSIINGTALIANVTVGEGPVTAAFDPSDGYVYVTAEYDGNESVFSGTSIVGNIPINLAVAYDTLYDAYNGLIYVLNTTVQPGRIGSHMGSALGVSLRGLTLVNSFNIGTGPQFGAVAAVDPDNGWLYVPDSGTSEVTVVNGSARVGVVPVGTLPVDTLFDPADGQIYVANEESYSVSVVNGTTITANPSVGIYPESMTFNPGTSEVYVANLGESTVSILGKVHGWPVTFEETGLTPGTGWTVTCGAVAKTSNSSSIGFLEPNGTVLYSVSPVPGYSLNNTSSAGALVVTEYGAMVIVPFQPLPSSSAHAPTFPLVPVLIYTGLGALAVGTVIAAMVGIRRNRRGRFRRMMKRV